MVFDEFASMYFSERSFGDLWGWWLSRETNPPLFYSILKLWRSFVPESQSYLRLLPLLISLAQIGLVGRLAGKTSGWVAALACVLLFALSPSDIYQSEYLRGYTLAKLAVTVSFIGLLAALNDHERQFSGWAAYAAGAVAAIYSHTTMLLWPAIATLAALVEAAWQRELRYGQLARLFIANLIIAALAIWELRIVIFQMHLRAPNISWIRALSLDDFVSSLNLQLLLAGSFNSLIMGTLIVVGALRSFHVRATRMALVIVVATVLAFKAADRMHPITTDYTLHWCATFTVLLAASAFVCRTENPSAFRKWSARLAGAVVLFVLVADGLTEIEEDGSIPTLQDWHYVLVAVAHEPRAALLVSHESIGVVVKQACKLQFHSLGCPFPLVVMQNPATTDNWASGGYGGQITPAAGVRSALGTTREVFVFSRYVYAPLTQLRMDPGYYREVEWDDGELIGPIPVRDFDKRG
jgi:uncharacterized membrane protein